MVRDGEPLLILLRGDHQLSPAKLPGARQAEADEIRELVWSRSRLAWPRRRQRHADSLPTKLCAAGAIWSRARTATITICDT